MTNITSTRNDDLYRALDDFFLLAQGYKSENVVPTAKVAKTLIYPIFHEDFSRYWSWEKNQSKGAESRISFLKRIKATLGGGLSARLADTDADTDTELGQIIRYCKSKEFDFDYLLGLLDSQIRNLVSFDVTRTIEQLRDDNPEHFDLTTTISKIKKVATDSVGTAIEALQTLGEINAINDQYTILMGKKFDTKSLSITRDVETKLYSELRDLRGPLFLAGNAGSGKSVILTNLNVKLKSAGKLVFFLTADDLLDERTQKSISELSTSEAVCSDLVILVDGVDRRLHEIGSKKIFDQLYQLSEKKQFGLLLTCRNHERERHFPDAKTKNLDSNYSFSEFHRAYFAFCDTVFSYRTELTNNNFEVLKTSIEEQLPITSLALNPLSLRFILEVFSSRRIQPEINSVELFSLFWKVRVKAESQRKSTAADLDNLDLSECVLFLAEHCLESRETTWDARDLDAMILMGGIRQTDFDQLLSRGIILAHADLSGAQQYAFFHQTILEYACALSILWSSDAKRKSRSLWDEVQNIEFSTYHLPIFNKLVQFACVLKNQIEPFVWEVVEEALENQIPHLVSVAIEAFSLSPRLRSNKLVIFQKILKDQFLAARFIQNSNNFKQGELEWLWEVFTNLWLFERELALEKKPNVMRTAILKELSSIMFRDNTLAQAQIEFFWAGDLYQEIPKQEMFYLCDSLVVFVRKDRNIRFSYFTELIAFLAENAGNKNSLLYRIAYRIRSVKQITKDQSSQVKQILESVEDARLGKIIPRADAWSWPSEAPPPCSLSFRELMGTEPHLNILHEWSLDQGKEELAAIWAMFVDEIYANPLSGMEPQLWMRIIWDRLGKELYEQGGVSSQVGYEFLVDAISDGLNSNSDGKFAAAKFVCSEIRNLDLLIGVFGQAENKILSSEELTLIFSSAIAHETGEVEFEHLELNKVTKKQLKRVTSNIGPLTQKWPKLENQLLNLSIFLGDFPSLFNDVYEGRFVISEFLPLQKQNLEEQIITLLKSEKLEAVQRGSRTIALQTRLPEKISIEQGLIENALGWVNDEQAVDWLCVAGYLMGLNLSCRSKFDDEMLRVVASGNEFVSPKAVPILVETALTAESRFERSEVFKSLETNIDVRKARWYLVYCFGLSDGDADLAQSKVSSFFYGNTFREMGTAQTATIRRVVRVPFANWLSKQTPDFALGLIRNIDEIYSDFAILVCDSCLNSRHFMPISEAIQAKLADGKLELSASQTISAMLAKKLSGATNPA